MGNAQEKLDDDFEQTFADELEPGHTLMHGQYTIESFLNAGGFGITYAAKDSLGRKVVIKECFPGSFCRRSTQSVTARSRAHQRELSNIVRLFVQEAHSLAKLDHPNIVGVHQVFEENNTAYMALDFINGRDLLDIIENPVDVLEPEEVEKILRKVLDAVDFIHQQGVLHRDISPDNILLKTNQEPILIDFGAAREQASKQSRVLSALRVVKDGYSPQEFYIAGSEQGPFSDLYALGATFYHLLTGELPANSQARLSAVASGVADPYEPLIDRMPSYPEPFLRAVDQALAILPKDRISSAKDWIAILDGKDDAKPAAVIPKTSAAAPAPAAAKSGGSSKAMLLGGVALVALVAGAVLFTQSGDDAAVDTPQTAIPAPTVEATAQPSALAEPAAPVVTETAPVVSEDAPVVTEDAPAVVTDAPAVVEEPAAPVVTAELIMQEAAPALPSINPHPDVVDVLTPPVRVTLAPAVTQVNPHPDVVDVLTPPVRITLAPAVTQVNPHPAVFDYTAALTITPPVESLRPRTRRGPTGNPHPDVVIPVELATIAQPETLAPTAGDASVAEANRLSPQDVADLAFGSTSIPDRPAPGRVTQVSAADSAAIVPTASTASAVSAIEPEIYDLPGLQTGWFVQLPYEGIFSAGEGETQLFAVNGMEVSGRVEFAATLRANAPAPQGPMVDITVLTGQTRQSANEQTWTVPVVHRTYFLNGLAFETRHTGSTWETTVTTAPADLGLNLEPGDVIAGDLNAQVKFEQRTSLPDLIAASQATSRDVLTLAVQREGDLHIVSLPNPTQP